MSLGLIIQRRSHLPPGGWPECSGIGGRNGSEWPVGMDRNGGPESFGISGRNASEYAILEISEKNKPRGRQKRIHQFSTQLKKNSGILYSFFKYWCKRPKTEWPPYLKKLLIKIQSEGEYQYHIKSHRGLFDPKGFAEYCIYKIYNETIQLLDLDPFSDPVNFYLTYIQSDKRPRRFTEGFIKGKSPQEVSQLAFTVPALNSIFSNLKLF